MSDIIKVKAVVKTLQILEHCVWASGGLLLNTNIMKIRLALKAAFG